VKQRWSAPYVLGALLAVGLLVALFAPEPRSGALNAGLEALSSVPRLTQALAARGAKPETTPAPTATPLATATPLPSPTHTPTSIPTPTKAPVVSRAIFVDQDAQMVHVYENGVEIRTIPCSTGVPVPGKATPAWVGRVGDYVGTFFAFGTYQDEGWVLFEDFLIHGAPYTWKDGVKVYQDLDALGVRPASHGCVRISPEDAAWLTAWNPKGVPIAISPLTRKFEP